MIAISLLLTIVALILTLMNANNGRPNIWVAVLLVVLVELIRFVGVGRIF